MADIWKHITRALAIILLIGLLVADYGFGVLARDFPETWYGILFALAIGVDLPVLRKVILKMITGASDKEDKNDGK